MESRLCTRERREHLPSPAQTLTELYHYSIMSTLYVMIHVFMLCVVKDDGQDDTCVVDNEFDGAQILAAITSRLKKSS